MSKAVHIPNTKWGIDKKTECAIAVMAYGSIEKAAKQCDISPKTLGHWSRHDVDYIAQLDNLRGEKAQEAQHTYGLIVEKAQAITLAKLDESTAAQASLIACQAQDKQLLLQGKPQRITEQQGGLQQMYDTFRQLSRDSIRAELKDKVLITNIIEPDEAPD